MVGTSPTVANGSITFRAARIDATVLCTLRRAMLLTADGALMVNQSLLNLQTRTLLVLLV